MTEKPVARGGPNGEGRVKDPETDQRLSRNKSPAAQEIRSDAARRAAETRAKNRAAGTGR